MHAHVFIDEAWPLVKDFPQTDKAMANLGRSPMAIDQAAMDRRFRQMDEMGIDVHVISVHPSQFLYFLEPDLGARIVKMQNEKIAGLVTAHKDRFVGFGNLSLQQPDLAVHRREPGRHWYGFRIPHRQHDAGGHGASGPRSDRGRATCDFGW